MSSTWTALLFVVAGTRSSLCLADYSVELVVDSFLDDHFLKNKASPLPVAHRQPSRGTESRSTKTRAAGKKISCQQTSPRFPTSPVYQLGCDGERASSLSRELESSLSGWRHAVNSHSVAKMSRCFGIPSSLSPEIARRYSFLLSGLAAKKSLSAPHSFHGWLSRSKFLKMAFARAWSIST